MHIILKTTVGAAALLSALPASAAVFMFNFTPDTVFFGSSYSGSGQFTTSDTAMTVGNQTAFSILSISGTANGSAIAAPAAAGISYGNYFTTGGFFLDGSGVNFRTAGGTQVSFFNQSNNNVYRVNSQSPGGSFTVNASSSAVAPVPEPATWALMLVGFGGMGYAMRSRRRQTLSFS